MVKVIMPPLAVPLKSGTVTAWGISIYGTLWSTSIGLDILGMRKVVYSISPLLVGVGLLGVVGVTMGLAMAGTAKAKIPARASCGSDGTCISGVVVRVTVGKVYVE